MTQPTHHPFLTALARFLFWLFPRKPRTIREELEAFLGRDFESLQIHEKRFPGYDLASVHRALVSLQADCCSEVREVGACGAFTLSQLFDWLRGHLRNARPAAPSYQRVPVDVEEEASFPINALSLAALRPELANGEPPAETEKIAVLLAVAAFAQEAWDGMEARHLPQQMVSISVACRSKAVADRFFAELENRRKRLSIFRGKVIDPVVGPGGIHTVGFRAIKKVGEEDLVLPESVRRLVRSSVLGFYQHRETLQGLGVELKRGILLHGPPGTGKTSIGLYLAGLLPQFTVCFVSGQRLLYPREVCRMARYLQPTMVVFEDIDLVAEERNATGLATVLGELMNQIDGCEPDEQVLFVMNTNSLERLERAVKNRPGRVDQIIEVPLPGREDRRRLLERFARNLRLAVADWDRLLRVTEGATPAMLKEIVKRAAVEALAERDGRLDGESLTVGDTELLLATEQVRALRDPEAVPGGLGFRDSRA